MAGFYWDPQVQDRRGELIASGISQAGQGIGAAIQNYKQKHDELKAYKTLADALAKDPTSGVDPQTVDKMSLPQLKMLPAVVETRRQSALAQQQRAAQGSLMQLLAQASANTKPQANVQMPARGNLYSTAIGNPASMLGAPTPGMEPGDAIMSALGQNPQAALSPQFGNVIKALAATRSRAPIFGTDPSGRTIVTSPTGVVKWAPTARAPQAAVPGPSGPPPKDVTPPHGWDWVWNGREWAMGREATSAGNFDPFPPGTGSTNPPPGPAGGNNSPKLYTDSSGKNYLYKGNLADPSTDTNADNWELVKYKGTLADPSTDTNANNWELVQ